MDSALPRSVEPVTVCRGVDLYVGDCLDVLPTMRPGSEQCVVTSPPYLGLRDYGIAPRDWPAVEYCPMAGLPPVRIEATRCVLGLEVDPLAYVGHLVEVFRAVRRVLRADGTCWVNLGPSYASGGKGGGGSFMAERRAWAEKASLRGWKGPPKGFKPKDLIGIPWMFALAMQADGWWLRSENIWAKKNPMPESVHDRPTAAHEQVFLFAKSAKYFYDKVAIAERLEHPEASTPEDMARAFSRRRATLADPQQGPLDARRYRSGNLAPKTGDDRDRPGDHRRSSIPWEDTTGTRNARSVWSIATQPFKGAHFATFPEGLAERCLLAGTSAHGCCAACGAPWRRVLGDGPEMTSGGGSRKHVAVRRQQGATGALVTGNWRTQVTIGWAPGCRCDVGVVPCRALDPFAGSGTVGAVARRLGRGADLVEASTTYVPLILERVNAPASVRRERRPKVAAAEQLGLFNSQGGTRP